MKKLLHYTTSLLLIIFIMCSCSNGESSKNIIPFTALNWDSSPNDVQAYHKKNPSSTYDADIGDKAYVYENTEYKGKTGKITYFFTNNDELVSVYFDFNCTDDNELDSLYNEFVDMYTEKYGNSDFSIEDGYICGKVWYEKIGNIGVMCNKFINKMVRLQYTNPEFAENN